MAELAKLIQRHLKAAQKEQAKLLADVEKARIKLDEVNQVSGPELADNPAALTAIAKAEAKLAEAIAALTARDPETPDDHLVVKALLAALEEMG